MTQCQTKPQTQKQTIRTSLRDGDFVPVTVSQFNLAQEAFSGQDHY